MGASAGQPQPNWGRLAIQAGRVFTPTTPIDDRALFAGRLPQVRRVIDAVVQRGQHAIVFGERGVGKTSMANVLESFLKEPGTPVLAPRVTCDTTDTFKSVWGRVFDQVSVAHEVDMAGFNRPTGDQAGSANDLIDGQASPDAVRRVLARLSESGIPIVIIDEFDRLDQRTRRTFADTVKVLSDHAVDATIVLVGVADSVDQLLQEHASVERALVQIHMPRMSRQEIEEILGTGLHALGMSIKPEAKQAIVALVQGLPHYAHLLGLNASRAALDANQLEVTTDTVKSAIARAINDAQQSIRSAYETAVSSSWKNNLFADVLLACAMAKTSETGQFRAPDVRAPLQQITGKDYDIPNFAGHLSDFSSAKRGNILEKLGTTRRFRYRFTNPLMQPYVMMHGYNSGRLSRIGSSS